PVRAHPIDQADLAGVHALHLNHAEAEAAGPLDVEELLVSRSQRGVEVVAGGRRTLVAGGGGSFADPTGAGDSLCALYCLARARGAEPADAARWAQREVE